MQRGLEAGRLAGCALDQEHPWRPDHLDQCLAQIVFRVGVADHVDHDPHRVESGLGGLHGLLDRGFAGGEVELDGLDQRAVQVPANRGPGRRVADDQRLRIGLLPLGERPRRVEPIDVGFGAEGHGERHGVDANPLGAQQARLAHGVAEILAAVADDDDVPPAVLGKDRATQLQRGGEIGELRVWLALELAELWVLADVHLDLRVAPKAEHAGEIVSLPLLQNAADHRGFTIQCALHAGREVGRDQERLAGRRRLDLESGERGAEEQDDQGAKAQRDASAPWW